MVVLVEEGAVYLLMTSSRVLEEEEVQLWVEEVEKEREQWENLRS